MERACRRVLRFERGSLWMEFGEAALAGMLEYSDWTSGCQERYALLL